MWSYTCSKFQEPYTPPAFRMMIKSFSQKTMDSSRGCSHSQALTLWSYYCSCVSHLYHAKRCLEFASLILCYFFSCHLPATVVCWPDMNCDILCRGLCQAGWWKYRTMLPDASWPAMQRSAVPMLCPALSTKALTGLASQHSTQPCPPCDGVHSNALPGPVHHAMARAILPLSFSFSIIVLKR